MAISKDTLPIPCNTVKEWEICVESWKFFKTASLGKIPQVMIAWTGDVFEGLYKSAIMIQGRNAALDDDVSFIIAHQAQNGHKLPCHPGCSACCKQAITANLFEAVLVGIYLIKYPETCDTFLEKYILWDKETKNTRDSFMDWAQQRYAANFDDGRFRYTDFRAPCPFLVDDLCQIYPVRPYCCRSYLAISNNCEHPASPDEIPGFTGIDVGSYTDFKQHNNKLLESLWGHFGIDQKRTRVRLLPDLVYRFLNGDSEELLKYCMTAD